MRAIDFDDIQIGDVILMYMPNASIVALEVTEINDDDRSVSCKDNYMDFYPNEDDQFIVLGG